MKKVGISPGSESVRAAKLLRYMMDGHQVSVVGSTYRIASEPEDVHIDSISINDFTLMEFRDLAECLDGIDFVKVMSYKENKNGKKG